MEEGVAGQVFDRASEMSQNRSRLRDIGDGTPCPVRFAGTTVSVLWLPAPHFRTAIRTAVALAPVAMDSDREYGRAIRATANPKSKNSVLVDVHIGHKEIMPPPTRLN